MHKLSRPKEIVTYKPRCQITGIQRGRNVQGEGAKKPEANKPGGESARHRGQISQKANKPGERARGKPARGEPAKGRNSQTPYGLHLQELQFQQ